MTDSWSSIPGPFRDGVNFNSTTIGDIIISWIRDNGGRSRGDSAIHALWDTASAAPARRITAAGGIEPLEGATSGLTVYGTSRLDRPGPELAAQQTPEYAGVLADFAGGRGETTFAGGDDALLPPIDVADKLHIAVRSVHRYHHDGRLPAADHYFGRTPVWRQATIDKVERRGPGRPAKTTTKSEGHSRG